MLCSDYSPQKRRSEDSSGEDINEYDILGEHGHDSIIKILTDPEVKDLAKLYPMTRISELNVGAGCSSSVRACPQTVRVTKRIILWFSL
jgi:hypothetical protein